MLKKENIDIYKENYKNNEHNKVMQRILNKVQLVDLIQDSDTQLNQEFNINIKTHKVANQQNSGRCWAFAGINLIKEKIIQKCKLNDIELSGNFISYYDKLERFNISLERLIAYKNNKKNLYDLYVSSLLETGIADVGYFTQFADLVNKYGIVPQDAFPETFASSHTYEINQILSRLLRKFYLDLQIRNDVNELKNEYMEKAYKIITNVYGIPPENFNFEYTDKNGKYHIDKNITPKEFYNKYIGIDLKNEYIEVVSYNDEKIKLNKLYQEEESSRISGESDNIVLNLPSKDFQNLIIKQLKTNEPVCFYCSTNSKRVDGIWIDLLERYGEIFDIDLKLDRTSILKTNGVTNCHVMLITGANIIDNKITKYKIENSWGNKYGKDGYYIATDDWINKYVFRIVINKNNLTKKQLEILNQECTKIIKWDIKF